MLRLPACFAGTLVLLLALAWPLSPARAAFPERDITVVVPWAAGGGTDTLARTLAKNGKKYFGVNLNVVNFSLHPGGLTSRQRLRIANAG